MGAAIEIRERQRIALVAGQLVRDLNNAQAAVDHHGGPMPESHFTLAAVAALAEFCAARAAPASAARADLVTLLTDVFSGELQKALRAPSAGSGG